MAHDATTVTHTQVHIRQRSGTPLLDGRLLEPLPIQHTTVRQNQTRYTASQAGRANGAQFDTTLTDEDKLTLEVLKGGFLDALGEDAVYEIQQQNPKDKIYAQDLARIKSNWEACYQTTRNVAESLVKLWNGVRHKDTPILQHWIDIGEKVAYCKLDQMTANDIEDHIHVAAFLATVNDPKQAKCYWEKKTDKATLAAYIRSTAAAEREMKRIQTAPTTSDKAKSETQTRQKVKDEPVGKIAKGHKRDRKSKPNESTKSRKTRDTHCYRCGEPDWTPDHGKVCKAKKATCKRCKKTGHFDKMCKTKLDRKEKVKKVNSDSEESSSEAHSATEDEDETTSLSDTSSSVNRVLEIRSPNNQTIEQLTVKAITNHSGRRTRQLERTGDEFEFMIRMNGHKIAAILDTGSPITILPKKYKSEIKPKRALK